MFPAEEARLRILNAFALGWQSSQEENVSESTVQSGIENAFDPQSVVDERKKVLAAITQRQGQPQFRKSLLEAYGGKCVLTDCDAECALEAAHILPYAGPDTNHVSNGLLLRADIHTLFDLGLLLIDPVHLTVILDPSLNNTSCRTLQGRRLHTPLTKDANPNKDALQIRFNLFAETRTKAATTS